MRPVQNTALWVGSGERESETVRSWTAKETGEHSVGCSLSNAMYTHGDTHCARNAVIACIRHNADGVCGSRVAGDVDLYWEVEWWGRLNVERLFTNAVETIETMFWIYFYIFILFLYFYIIFIFLYFYIFIFLYFYIFIFLYFYIFIFVYLYICIFVYLYICIFVYLYIFIFLYFYIFIFYAVGRVLSARQRALSRRVRDVISQLCDVIFPIAYTPILSVKIIICSSLDVVYGDWILYQDQVFRALHSPPVLPIYPAALSTYRLDWRTVVSRLCKSTTESRAGVQSCRYSLRWSTAPTRHIRHRSDIKVVYTSGTRPFFRQRMQAHWLSRVQWATVYPDKSVTTLFFTKPRSARYQPSAKAM